jgi:hypothetical protein
MRHEGTAKKEGARPAAKRCMTPLRQDQPPLQCRSPSQGDCPPPSRPCPHPVCTRAEGCRPARRPRCSRRSRPRHRPGAAPRLHGTTGRRGAGLAVAGSMPGPSRLRKRTSGSSVSRPGSWARPRAHTSAGSRPGGGVHALCRPAGAVAGRGGSAPMRRSRRCNSRALTVSPTTGRASTIWLWWVPRACGGRCWWTQPSRGAGP